MCLWLAWFCIWRLLQAFAVDWVLCVCGLCGSAFGACYKHLLLIGYCVFVACVVLHWRLLQTFAVDWVLCVCGLCGSAFGACYKHLLLIGYCVSVVTGYTLVLVLQLPIEKHYKCLT